MSRPGTAEYCIERDDGQYYLGTIEGNPVFGHGENAAVFDDREEAQRRLDALARRDPKRGFELEQQ